ncbi:transposase [Chloroflexota bacterium]
MVQILGADHNAFAKPANCRYRGYDCPIIGFRTLAGAYDLLGPVERSGIVYWHEHFGGAIGEIERFSSSQKLVGYAGLGAQVHASGDAYYTGKISKQGRR